MIKDRQLMLDQNKAMLARFASQDKIIARLSELEYCHSTNNSRNKPVIIGTLDNNRFMADIKYANKPRAYIWLDGVQIPLKMIDNIKGII